MPWVKRERMIWIVPSKLRDSVVMWMHRKKILLVIHKPRNAEEKVSRRMICGVPCESVVVAKKKKKKRIDASAFEIVKIPKRENSGQKRSKDFVDSAVMSDVVAVAYCVVSEENDESDSKSSWLMWCDKKKAMKDLQR